MGVAAHVVHADAGNDLGIAVVELHPRAVGQAHHRQYALQLVGVREERVCHVTAGRKCHLAVLQVEARPREQRQIARVVIVQVRDDDVPDLGAIDAQPAQALAGLEQQLPPALVGRRPASNPVSMTTVCSSLRATQTK